MSGARLAAGVERRIFVVGAPRSGTTLVQSLLAAHGGVTSFTESHLFAMHFALLPGGARAVLRRDPAPRLREFLVENGESPPESARWLAARSRSLAHWRPLLPLATGTVARRLLRVLDELALRRDRACWVEKTPRHLRFVPFLARLGGREAELRFVHVIRGGLEVVASLLRASRGWESPYDLDDCVRRWNGDLALSLRRLGAPTDHFLFYEELARAPQAALEPLLAELGLAWQPRILERYGVVAERLITEREGAWKERIGRGIRPSATAERFLDAEQRRRAGRRLRHDLYERLRQAVAGRGSASG